MHHDLSTLLERFHDHPAAITFADVSLPNQPLIFANRAFSKMTLYDAADVIGKNCRFLQGEKTNRSDIDLIREDISERRHTFRCILNYRKNGSTFHNILMLSPVDRTKYPGLFLGCQYEFAEHVTVEALREHFFRSREVREQISNLSERSDSIKLRQMRIKSEAIQLQIEAHLLSRGLLADRP